MMTRFFLGISLFSVCHLVIAQSSPPILIEIELSQNASQELTVRNSTLYEGMGLQTLHDIAARADEPWILCGREDGSAPSEIYTLDGSHGELSQLSRSSFDERLVHGSTDRIFVSNSPRDPVGQSVWSHRMSDPVVSTLWWQGEEEIVDFVEATTGEIFGLVRSGDQYDLVQFSTTETIISTDMILENIQEVISSPRSSILYYSVLVADAKYVRTFDLPSRKSSFVSDILPRLKLVAEVFGDQLVAHDGNKIYVKDLKSNKTWRAITGNILPKGYRIHKIAFRSSGKILILGIPI